jgi:hypothetical protein
MNVALHRLMDNNNNNNNNNHNNNRVVKHCNPCDTDISYSNWARHINDRHEGV